MFLNGNLIFHPGFVNQYSSSVIYCQQICYWYVIYNNRIALAYYFNLRSISLIYQPFEAICLEAAKTMCGIYLGMEFPSGIAKLSLSSIWSVCIFCSQVDPQPSRKKLHKSPFLLALSY
jgi:hypothetical protein